VIDEKDKARKQKEMASFVKLRTDICKSFQTILVLVRVTTS
jgi:hypothetical protein